MSAASWSLREADGALESSLAVQLQEASTENVATQSPRPPDSSGSESLPPGKKVLPRLRDEAGDKYSFKRKGLKFTVSYLLLVQSSAWVNPSCKKLERQGEKTARFKEAQAGPGEGSHARI